jgi:hypothetical protein
MAGQDESMLSEDLATAVRAGASFQLDPTSAAIALWAVRSHLEQIERADAETIKEVFSIVELDESGAEQVLATIRDEKIGRAALNAARQLYPEQKFDLRPIRL